MILSDFNRIIVQQGYTKSRNRLAIVMGKDKKRDRTKGNVRVSSFDSLFDMTSESIWKFVD